MMPHNDTQRNPRSPYSQNNNRYPSAPALHRKNVINPNIKLDLTPSSSWFEGKCPLHLDSRGRNENPLWRTLCLILHGACFKCGFVGHHVKNCPKSVVVGWPCTHQDHGPNDNSGCFHNSAYHVKNWRRDRSKYLISNSSNTALVNTNIFENDESADSHLFDEYSGQYFQKSECSDSFQGSFDPGTGYWIPPPLVQPPHVQSADFTTANTLTSTLQFDPAYDKCNQFTSLDQSVSSYRHFCRVILSNTERTCQVETILLFDSGSDYSFISESVRKKCYINGKSKLLSMSGINSSNRKYVKMCSAVLINPDNGNSFRLNNIGSLNLGKRQLIPSYTVPDKETINSTKGLENLPWPAQAECTILLGVDYQMLFDSIKTEFSTPFTVIEKCPLGIRVGGLLGDRNKIEQRTNQIKTAMSMDAARASVGCSSFDALSSFPLCESKRSFMNNNVTPSKSASLDSINAPIFFNVERNTPLSAELCVDDNDAPSLLEFVTMPSPRDLSRIKKLHLSGKSKCDYIENESITLDVVLSSVLDVKPDLISNDCKPNVINVFDDETVLPVEIQNDERILDCKSPLPEADVSLSPILSDDVSNSLDPSLASDKNRDSLLQTDDLQSKKVTNPGRKLKLSSRLKNKNNFAPRYFMILCILLLVNFLFTTRDTCYEYSHFTSTLSPRYVVASLPSMNYDVIIDTLLAYRSKHCVTSPPYMRSYQLLVKMFPQPFFSSDFFFGSKLSGVKNYELNFTLFLQSDLPSCCFIKILSTLCELRACLLPYFTKLNVHLSNTQGSPPYSQNTGKYSSSVS